ncbi:MAG: lamin tail domain-containing protein, partial [Myxococcales bacterium]|nr:lamin tail domain-containing protein [Myxococcales bacterium]
DTDADSDADTDVTGETGLPGIGSAVINEVLAAPPAGNAGNANCDGGRNPDRDDFVEIVNLGAADLDLSGGTLSDATQVRHTFDPGTILPVGGAIVVFGGGTPTFDGTGTAGPWCAALPSEVTVVTASSGRLDLDDTGDTVTLADAWGRTLDSMTYGAEGATPVSRNRRPELDTASPFVAHDTMPSSIGAFSPGTLADGLPISQGPDDTGLPTGDTGPIDPWEHTTIQDVRAGNWPAGTEVEVSGVVVGVAATGAFVQAAGGGAYSGIWVYGAGGFPGANVGDAVDTVGRVADLNGLATIDLTTSAYAAFTRTGAGTVPATHVDTVDNLLADPEPWESALVEVQGVVVDQAGIAGNEFGVRDPLGTNQLRVDDLISLWSDYGDLQAGDSFSSISGPFAYLQRFKIEPRDDSDLSIVPSVLINEVMVAPPTGIGDTNCDGIVSSADDEFVEIWSDTPGTIDLAGATLLDAVQVRHTFPAGSTLARGERVVVFGGGNPVFDGSSTSGTHCASIGGARFQVASTGSLGLDNTGDSVTLQAGPATLDAVTFGPEGDQGESLNRDPDLGVTPLVLHSTVAGAVNPWSPGASVSAAATPFSLSPTIDGSTADWPVTTLFTSSAGTDTRIAWDDTNLYLAVTHPAIAAGTLGVQLVVALGDGTGAGTTSGLAIGAQQPTLAFPATRTLVWAVNDSASSFATWTGAAWTQSIGWLGTSGSSYAVDTGTGTVEIAVPLSELGAGLETDLTLALVNVIGGTSGAVVPAAAFAEGSADPDWTQGYAFHLRLDTFPITSPTVP